ncbi:hypothetical protein Agub_g1925, partial [Astrephomene gubernaculifera]
TVAAAAAAGGSSGDPQSGDISSHNLAAVSRMAPQQVAEALQELSSRLSPQTLEFLRRRGAARLGAAGATQSVAPQQQQQQRYAAEQHAAGGGGGGPLAGSRRAAALAVAGVEPASCSSQEAGNALIDSALRALTTAPGAAGAGAGAAAGGRGRGGGGLLASVAAPGSAVGALPIGALAAAQQQQQRAQQHQQQQGSGVQGVGGERGGGSGGTAGAAAEQKGSSAGGGGGGATRGSPADPRLVARLRFDLDGSVVDVQGPEETFVEEEVLLRDQLRRDEGAAPPGYTLG